MQAFSEYQKNFDSFIEIDQTSIKEKFMSEASQVKASLNQQLNDLEAQLI